MFLWILACTEAEKEDGSSEGSFSEETNQLWDEISDYQTWNQLENWQGILPSESVHGVAMQTWYNDIAYDALMIIDINTMPENSIIVKEGYQDANGTDINTITVMKKINGYNPDAGDWYWASFNPDGSSNASGIVDFCVSCHAGSQVDYLLIDP